MIYSRERAFKAAKLTVYLKSVAQLLGILVTILLVKILTEEDYGVYTTFIASITIIGSVLSLGIGNTLQRFIPKYVKQQEFILTKKIIKVAFWARLLSLVFLCCVGYVFRNELTSWMNVSNHVALILPFIFIVLLHFQTRLLSTVLSACLFQGVNQVAQITLVFTKVVLYGYFLSGNYELMFIFIADLIAYSLMLIVVVIGYFRLIKPMTGGREAFENKEKKGMLKYAAYNNLNDVGLISLGRDIDVLFLASMVDVISAGAYAFANRIGHILRQVSPVSYFINIIRPLFFTLDVNKDKENIRFYFNLLLKMNYVFELPMICGLYLFYPYIIELFFDGKYAEYQLLVTLVFIIVCSSSFGIYVGLLAQLKERADIIFYSKFFAIINILGNLLLIPIFGVYGAVISTLLSILSKDIFVFYFIREAADIKSFIYFLFMSIVYWSIVALIGNFISGYLVESIPTFFAQGILCLIFYFVFIRFSIFSKSEKKFLIDVSKNKKKRLKIIGI